MRRFTLILFLACALLAGCAKAAKPRDGAREDSSTAALWALAPADTRIGVVVAGGTGELLLAARAELERSLASMPGNEQAVQDVLEGIEGIEEALPPQALDAEAHAEMGLDLGLGAALFETADGDIVAVLPVADRAAFVAAVGGTSETRDGVAVDRMNRGECKAIAGRYVCASTAALLDQVGQSDALARRVNQRPADLRGHIEVVVDGSVLAEEAGDMMAAVGEVRGLDAALRLARGALTVRAHLDASPSRKLAGFARVPSDLSAAAAATAPTGIWRLRVPLREIVPPEAVASLGPVAAMGNIDIEDDLIGNLTGELVVHAPGGKRTRIVIELGARDGKRLQPLVAALCAMGQGALPMVKVEAQGERCKATLDPASLGPKAAEMGLQGPITAELYAEAGALGVALALSGMEQGGAVEITPVGRDLATGAWNWAAWYQGHPFGSVPPDLFALLSDTDEVERVRPVLWSMAHLAELGIAAGVREDGVHALVHVGTQWANPDDVVRAHQSALAALLGGDAAAADKLRALAESVPETTLGRTYRAGVAGMIASYSSAGMLAAVAIPAFTRYQQKAKALETPMPPDEM